MKSMNRLLANVGRSWSKVPKDVGIIRIEPGEGGYPLLTIDRYGLHLHGSTYSRYMPDKHSIALEELRLDELVNRLNHLGYDASITGNLQKHTLHSRKAFTLTHVSNLRIGNGSELTTFTSKLWETLYPVARLLEDAENDVDEAVSQMFVHMARGKWLDYWAGFFNIRRMDGESDDPFLRRLMMLMFSTRTNKVAIEELVRYRLKDESVSVEDITPAEFELLLHVRHTDYVRDVHTIINDLKGAGINYILGYTTGMVDHLRVTSEAYNIPNRYPICNVLHTSEKYGVLLKQKTAIKERFYTLDILYPICNTFLTSQVSVEDMQQNVVLTEEYRSEHILYPRAGDYITGQGELT